MTKTTTGMRHYGWVIVANGFLVEMVVMGAVLYAYGVFALPFSREFGIGMFGAMLGLAGLNVAVALLSPVAGYLVSRGSIRTYMIVGLGLIAIGFVCLAGAARMWQVVAAYGILIGFGYALVAPIAASAVIANWFTGLRGRALSIAAIGTSFGGFVFPPVAAAITAAEGWRVTALVFAGVCLLNIPVIWALVVDTPAEKGLKPYGEKSGLSEAEAADAAAPEKLPSTKALLTDPTFWYIAAAISGAFAVFMGFTANLVPYAASLDFDETRSALLLSCLTAFAMSGKVIFAAVTDRLGLGRTYLFAVSLMGIGVIPSVFAPGFVSLVLASGCVGFASGGLLPSWPRYVGSLFGRKALAKVMGLMALPVNGAMMVSPPVTGLIYDLTGEYRGAMIMFCVLALTVIGVCAPLNARLRTGQ